MPPAPRIRETMVNLAGHVYWRSLKRSLPVSEGSVIALNYHRISGAAFRSHLEYIRKDYDLLSPSSFLDWLDNRLEIKRPSIIITFDDGYLGFYKEIYPVLQETGVPVFMFIPTGFIGSSSCFWEDELQVALEKTRVSSVLVNGKRFHLASRIYRSDFHEVLRSYLREFPPHVRNRLKEECLRQLHVRLTEADLEDCQFLSWQQVVSMHKSDLVTFGAHSVNHPKLTLLSAEDILWEVQHSKKAIEEHTETRVSTFAFPYGGPGFVNEAALNAVKDAGFLCAFTTIQGVIQDKGRERFTLPRLMLFEYQHPKTVAMKIAMGLRHSTPWSARRCPGNRIAYQRNKDHLPICCGQLRENV